jgi:tetratricopeptide (TPR) repeat protein
MRPSVVQGPVRWLAALLAAVALPAGAYQFEPTEAEFNAWPHYCRARYVTTTIGQTSVFAQRMDRTSQATAEGTIGPQTFLHIHHYCAGLVHLARARLEPDPQRRRFQLDEARSEILYSMRNDPGNGPLQSTMVVNLAVVERERGDLAAARQLLESAIRQSPADPKPYLGLAIILRGDKKVAEARTILEQGLAAAGDEAVELHYNLGLMCVELEDFECAVRHAQAAYAQGYPFPGLKNRLADRGLWQK